jgi:hypothetical protein
MHKEMKTRTVFTLIAHPNIRFATREMAERERKRRMKQGEEWCPIVEWLVEDSRDNPHVRDVWDEDGNHTSSRK